ncbi:MAG: DUF6516 family protein [Deltaproteobacteria bacterium]|nr:DUF6516 family protein [Deltaproteobacteria bacterium]
MDCEPEDAELITLLDLDGFSFWLGSGFWVKFEAREVPKDKHRPHGIGYSLTLHDRNNTRVLGLDNAHAIKRKGRRPKKYTGRIITWDHIHRQEKIERYLFSSASQLIDDFWKCVNEIVGD